MQVIAEHQRWLAGYGLGLILRRDGERILAGHTGSMPGFIAFLFASPAEKVVAAVLTNESQAVIGELGLSLVRTAVEEWPVAPEPWRVGEPPPDDVVPLLGLWSSAGATGSWRHAPPRTPTGSRPRSSSRRPRIAGARSRGRSTARRCGSCALRTARWSGWSGRDTPSRANQAPGALQSPSSRYSYWSASSTLSFAARRAGQIAARRPTMIAAITK